MSSHVNVGPRCAPARRVGWGCEARNRSRSDGSSVDVSDDAGATATSGIARSDEQRRGSTIDTGASALAGHDRQRVAVDVASDLRRAGDRSMTAPLLNRLVNTGLRAACVGCRPRRTVPHSRCIASDSPPVGTLAPTDGNGSTSTRRRAPRTRTVRRDSSRSRSNSSDSRSALKMSCRSTPRLKTWNHVAGREVASPCVP